MTPIRMILLRSNAFIILLFLLTSWCGNHAMAQQKFPVTGNTLLSPPYSPYISDYISPGSTNLRFNFVFNDFREPSWQVRLRIKIESIDLKLQTRAEFRPSAPIVVTPGVSVELTSADFVEYMDFKNLTILGSASGIFLQNGRFPEGNYTFCIEVLDYPTGVVLSNVACTSAWIRLNDPPKIITPACDAYIDPTLPLNIPFQWQLFNSISPNATLGNEYKLVVYELTDPYANPFTAIANGKVLQIFESDPQQQTSFVYNTSSPALDIGKTYVYQIKAKDNSGRDLFKNNGLSEVCWFHYGYPENGKVITSSPVADKNYKKGEQAYFKWSAPDLRIKNQPFIYELKIVVLDKNQNPEQAIADNTVYYSERTTENRYTTGMDFLLRRPLKPGLEYAWQITTYSASQTVAKSDVKKMIGPPLIDQFYAGNHLVAVIKANNNDSLNFSGTAKFRSGQNDSVEVTFDKLKLKRIVSYWVLEGGELKKDLPTATAITLLPRDVSNGPAKFLPKAIRLNKDELALQGDVNWNLPHATKSGAVAVVKSERSWLNYDKFKLLGAAKFANQNQFDLLDPADFSLQLSTSSDFLISDDKFELRAEGNIQLPDKIKGKQKGKVSVPFPRTGQLFYIDSLKMNNDIAPVENIRIYLHPTLITLDLSENQSPGNKSSDVSWKGIYVNEYEIQYNSFTDRLSQLKFNKEVIQRLTTEEALASDLWADGRGLNLRISKDFSKDSIQFNSFFGRMNHLEMRVENNQISSSTLTGEVLLPVFSASEFYPFTIPVTGDGLQAGYLDSFDDKSFTFNKGGGEQEINVTVKRGVFEEQRLLNMSLQIDWPSLDVSLQSVSAFKLWGDYKVGFDTPNGVRALDTQLQASLNGYPVTIDAISAGSNEGFYSFAISAKTQMGEDVSGQSGPPSVNIYSVITNKFAPAGPVYIAGQSAQMSQQEISSVQQEYASVAGKVVKDLSAANQEAKDAASETLLNLTSQQTTIVTMEDTGAITSVSADSTLTIKQGGLLGRLNAKQQGIVKEIITTVVNELSKSITDPVDQKAKEINSRILHEMKELTSVIQRQVDDKVSSLVSGIARPFINASANSKADVSSEIEQLAQVVSTNVALEVNRSIEDAISTNITDTLIHLVQAQIADRITNYVRASITTLVIKSLEGEISLDQVPDVLLEGMDTVLNSIAESAFEKLNFSSVSTMLSRTANDAIKNIDTDRIVSEIGSGVAYIVGNKLGDELNKHVATAVSDFLNKQAGIDVPINFSRLAFKLASGGKLFSIDSVSIQLKSKILDLNGFVFYKADQPVYGNVWLGDIDVLVKHPKPFSLSVTYLNGRTVQGTHYWFAQIAPSDGVSAKLGDVMPKRARALTNPISLGVASMVGVSGRVYRHMKDGDQVAILPDSTNEYGAYLNIILFDNKGGQAMRLDVAGEYIMTADKNYIITFDGNIQIMNKDPKVLEIDPAATIKGVVSFSYNSAEEHFLGYGRVEIINPGKLCAHGSVMVDTKPGLWRVEIGSREDRIVFVPSCYGWSPTGWLAVTQSEAELGLGLQYSIYAETPTVNFVVVKANIAIDAGIAAGIVVGVRYKPDFALIKAGIWADLWANLLVNYKKVAGNWKSVSILAIYARGDLTMYFEPKPTTLEGSLKGSVRLLSIVTIDFDANFKKELS